MQRSTQGTKTISFSRFLFRWLLCTILPFIGFSAWYAYQQAYQSTERYALEFANQVAEHIQTETQRFLMQPERQLQAVIALGQADLLQLDDPYLLVKQLAVLQQQAPNLTFLSFGFADGQYVSSARPPEPNSNLEGILSLLEHDRHLTFVDIDDDLTIQLQKKPRSNAHYDSRERSWFLQAIEQGKPSWYPVGRYRAYDSLGVGISAPVLDSHGQFLGVATADIALNQLSHFLQITAKSKHGLYFVAEPDGALLAVSDASPTFQVLEVGYQRIDAINATDPVISLMWQHHQSGKSGQVMAKHNGNEFVIHLQSLPLTNGPELLIAMAHPQEMFTGPLNQLATTLMTAFFFITVVSILVMLLVARRVTRPLTALSRWAEQLSKQNWQAPQPSSGGIKELQVVNADLKQMATQLQNQTEQLAQQVEHRTEELQRTLVLLQHILRSAAGLSIVVTNSSGKIILFNKGAELLTGYSANEAKTEDNLLFLHAQVQDNMDACRFINHLLEQQATAPLMHYRHKSGLECPVSLLVTPILDKSDNLTGYLFIAQDKTEQQKLTKLKSDFVSIVSHELRTPLTSISAAMKLLNAGAMGALTEPQQRLTSIAEQNCLRLQQLINDLLDMDKLLAGKMNYQMQVWPIAQLVQDAVAQNSAYASQHQIRLILKLPQAEHCILVDELRFQQVMSNLLSNAIKFSHPGSDVEIQVDSKAGAAVIRVIDQGCGIPTEFQAKLFEKFSQAEAINTRQHQGTGLGLAICKQLTEQMHGSIGFRSEQGVGTEFYVEFPLHKPES
ncbi:ATP-binding protein [Alkalimonas delamerensis]|uniref:histidine kinase n=1 Tax=Alkalimonas delamerensis TaxID=265981 RepID=A0ABT9GQ59_9GAMM|nr:ATP-binding protein [Alkalimonas delamerensis]MDP4529116.1 ATP-binding protein [Alkalimonas delamerensis]